MIRYSCRPYLLATGALGSLLWASQASAMAIPKVSAALELKPVQKGVQYDLPAGDEIAQCTIKAERFGEATAWVLRQPDGLILRRFADTNADNVVDTWSYFLGGLEVYRDVDADFNGKADQYRWFHTAGTRWGLDENEDRVVDNWKRISAEELAEEVVACLQSEDPERFEKLLVTQDDVRQLGLAKDQAEALLERIKSAPGAFRELVKSGEFGQESTFSDFGGAKPGTVPAGTRGSTKDVTVYENVWAMVRHGDDHKQLRMGTLVEVGDAWKLVGSPALDTGSQVADNIFFDSPMAEQAATMASSSDPPSEKMQSILEDLQKLDERINRARPSDQAKLHKKRADLLQSLANEAPNKKEREQWLGQLADMVSASVQGNMFPEGVDYLDEVIEGLDPKEVSRELITHFKFRRMQADYGRRLAEKDAPYPEIQKDWLEQLEEFVEQNGKSPHVSEALLQLAMASEFNSENDSAEKWYRRIITDFPQSAAAPKARGAVTRLTSVGRVIRLQGTDLLGSKVDLRQYKGRVVVVQYWSTTCDPCKADHAVLKELLAKYGRRGFQVIGVNLDFARQDALGYLKSNNLPWKQMYEKGGFDSRLANEMGVITLPLMLLIDQKNQVVSASIQAAELEEQVKELLGQRGEARRRATGGQVK